jgi:putative N6-adenine-specific DNA methylase
MSRKTLAGAATRPVPTHTFDAVVAPGLEPVLVLELAGLGVEGEPSPGIVRFTADDLTLLKVLLCTRIATRVLEVIAEQPCRTFADLEDFCRHIEVGRYGKPGASASSVVTTSKSRLYHTGAIAERVARTLGVKTLAWKDPTTSPGAQAKDCDVVFHVRVAHDVVRLSVDAAGERLHRRGYRLEGGRAPLRESLAAGILATLGWTRSMSLVDPMCGSGTFPIEAAWMASGRAPGRDRPVACGSWPGLGGNLDALRGALRSKERDEGLPALVGVDRDQRAIEHARENATRAAVNVTWAVSDARDVGPGDLPPGLVIANLPYGKRIEGAARALSALERMAERFAGWEIAALWAPPGPLPEGWTERLRVTNGGIALRVMTRPGGPR